MISDEMRLSAATAYWEAYRDAWRPFGILAAYGQDVPFAHLSLGVREQTLAAVGQALEAVAPSIRAQAMEEAAEIVKDAGWFRSSPDDVHWSTIDEQIEYSIAAIRAAKETA